jgi:phage terminase large subunit
MKTTATFSKIAEAYHRGKRFIISRGGTRSGKTFAELQLLFLIATRQEKPRIITTVSQTLPQLKSGAIRDYDNILRTNNIIPDSIRIKNPYIYTHGKTLHEFISFDNVGNALGASRDILFINEGNRMKWETVHQLITRTTETVFIDFNPSNRFWVEEIEKRDDAVTLTSTFLDNIKNLSAAQLSEFKMAKEKAEAEEAKGTYGYWSNWWRVYGLGEYGQIESVIYTDWEIGDFDETLPYRFGLDFGFTDPDALVKIAVDERRKIIYLHECIYKVGLPFESLTNAVKAYCQPQDRIIADSAQPKLIKDMQRNFNITPAYKWKVAERVKKMQSYHIVVTRTSDNLINELNNYVWSDRKSETPIDDFNHLLDAAGYALTGQPKIAVKTSSV